MDEKKPTVLPFRPRTVLPPPTDEVHALVGKLFGVFAAEPLEDDVVVQALAVVIGKIAANHPDPVTVIGAAAFQAVYQILGDAGVLRDDAALNDLLFTPEEPKEPS